MASPDDLASWYGNQAAEGPPPKRLEDIFQRAKEKYADAFTIGSREQAVAESARGLHDVQAILQNAVSKYESKQRFPVLRDRLNRLSGKIHYYGNVVDVLVQHHPEYVSLVWGAMKFLFTAVVNHERILKSITQVLSQVADSLPRLELSYALYSNKRMEDALTDLYVSLLEFFMKAHEWYDEGSLLRAYHSVIRPWELKFQDSLDRIDDCSRRIEKLAFAGMQAEIRELHNLNLASLSQIKALHDKHDLTNQQVLKKISRLLDVQSSSQALHSSALVDNNTSLTESQVTDIVASISEGDSLWGCMKTYQYCRIARNQRRNTGTQMQTRPFWLDPKLRKWTCLDRSALVAIQGNLSSRPLLKDFAINIIDELRSNNVMPLWLLNPIGKGFARPPSSAEVMKQLVLQIIHDYRSKGTEKSMALAVARLRGAKTSQDWVALLQSILAQATRQIYVLIDLEAFYDRSGGGNGILFLELLWDICNALSQHATNPKVKVLVLSYGRTTRTEMSSCTVTVQATQVPARRKKAFRDQQMPCILGARGIYTPAT
ncbi:hypothetical protein Hte_007873 [Hypoxylon texense]